MRPYAASRISITRYARSLLAFVCLGLGISGAQDLAPRAYIITPTHSNAVTVTYSYYNGDLLLDGAVPITGATNKTSVSVLSFTHSLRIFGRSGNVTASLPYGVGDFKATVIGFEASAHRSGMLDSSFRFSVNLRGGPAMDLEQFRQWRQKLIIGASFKVVAPTGQYDPTKLINFGTNRWAFKPELGLSRRWSHWVLDTYAAGWFFTTNNAFFSQNQFSPGINTQKQNPTFAFEGHLSYDVKPRLWTSLDGNFWAGGSSVLNGVENPKTEQRNSRIGGTVSIPISRRHSLKFSYNRGAYILYGGNYQNVSVAWQYSWLGRPN